MLSLKNIFKQELGALFDDDDGNHEISQKQIEEPPIQKTAYAPPPITIKKESPKQQKQEITLQKTPSLSSENFLNTAQSIITDCDRVFALIERTASANKEQALKIKNQTKQILGLFESKIQSLLKNEHCKSSIAQKETESLIMKNEAHLTSLKQAIGSLEQQIKQIEIKMPKKKVKQTMQFNDTKSHLKQHTHEEIKCNISNQQIIDNTQRRNIELNGFCEPYFSVFDRISNQTLVYHCFTNKLALIVPIKQSLLAANDNFMILGMTPYFLAKDGSFSVGQEFSELREKVHVAPTCAAIIQGSTLVLGYPHYTKIHLYDLETQFSPKIVAKQYVFMSTGSNKDSGILQVQESKINRDSIIISLKRQIIKISLITTRESKSSTTSGLPHDEIINVGNQRIQEFRQVEDQYLAVLTSAYILIVDQFSSQILCQLQISHMDQILPCPGFSLDQRPWVIQISEGRILMKDITGHFKDTESHQLYEANIAHIIGQTDDESTLYSVTHKGELMKSCLKVF